MRLFSRTCEVSLLVIAFTSLASCSTAILGIDYGTEFVKAALVKPGVPLEIVLTKDSKRKEVAAIAFKPKGPTAAEGASPERLYGTDAVNFAARFPNDVYPNLKPLLGAYVMDDVVTGYSKRYSSLQLTGTKNRQTVAFQSIAAPDGQFTVEELVAMQLASIKASGEAMAGSGWMITDCVITVPAYFTSEERYALITAAEIAGLKVMTLISDGLAVGLNYATSRTFSTPEHHIIYDMGAGSTTASVVKFSGKSIKETAKTNKTVIEVAVLGVGFDKTLGGDFFNQKIADYLLEEFTASKAGERLAKSEGKPVTEVLNGKSYAKLWREAARVRQVLSANSETVASIESIYPEVDFRSGKIPRTKFEELAADYVSRIVTPINDALANAKFTAGIAGIDSLILTGGAVRTPFVQKALVDLVGEKISKNVNADEAAVMGATFRAASLSKSFRVKEIRVVDINPYSVGLRYTAEGSEKVIDQTLFPASSKLANSKFITVKRTTDLDLAFYHLLGKEKNAKREEITVVSTTNLTDSVHKLKSEYGCIESTITTLFEIRLNDKDGMPEVVEGCVSCEYERKKTAADGVKGFFGFGGKKDDQKVLEDESSSSSKSKKSTSTKSGKFSKSSKTSSGAAASSTEVKNKTEKITVAFTSKRSGFPEHSSDAISTSVKRLGVFDRDDAERVARETVRNELEGFTYRCLEYLSSDSFIAVSTEDERSSLEAALSKISDWVYSKEAEMSSHAVLSGKLTELKKIEAPITKRRKESETRPQKLKELEKSLGKAKVLINDAEKALASHEERQSASKEAAAKSSSEAEEAASSSSSSSAAAASEAAASASSASTETTSTASLDDLEGLEDTETSSSTKTTRSTSTKKTPKPTAAPYTASDVETLSTLYDDIKKWLADKIKAQGALKVFEDPVLTTSDLRDKLRDLESIMKRVKTNKPRYVPPPKPTREKIKVQGPNGMEDIDIEELLKRYKEEEAAAAKETLSGSEGTSTVRETATVSTEEARSTVATEPEPKDEL